MGSGNGSVHREWPWSLGIPFVPAACGARILEIEETTDYAETRHGYLRRAGISDTEGPEVCPDLEDAVARRLSTPEPALAIVCRLRLPAGAAIRRAEAERGLRPLPMIVAGGRPLPELATCARAVGATSVLAMHGGGSYDDSFGGALVEAVLRTGWAEAFSLACASDGTEHLPWADGTADASSFPEPDAELVTAMRREFGGRLLDAVTDRWMANDAISKILDASAGDGPDADALAEFMRHATASRARIDDLLAEGDIRALIPAELAPYVRAPMEVSQTFAAAIIAERPAPTRFHSTPDGPWVEERLTPHGWETVRTFPPAPEGTDPLLHVLTESGQIPRRTPGS